MNIDKKHIITLQGKDFVLFSGLLDLAHNQGLKETRTELLQIPNDTNGHVAVVRATVVTEKGSFQAIGDASPDNVTRMILPHIIRMSETRALARALRIATNVGVTALEEMGEMETGPQSASKTPVLDEIVARKEKNGGRQDLAQIRASFDAMDLSPEQRKSLIEEVIGKSIHRINDLNQAEAEKVIKALDSKI